MLCKKKILDEVNDLKIETYYDKKDSSPLI